MDDAECSELCSCTETLTLTCHALCVPFAPCRTALAFYSHASPAYQAFRGRCLCYSGRFICMRPPPGEYSLPGKKICSTFLHKFVTCEQHFNVRSIYMYMYIKSRDLLCLIYCN